MGAVNTSKKIADGKWEAYYDNGREHEGLDVVEWAKKGYELGAGEILLTSVDKESTKKGFDIELVKAVSDIVQYIIACGGMGAPRRFHRCGKNWTCRCSGSCQCVTL